MIVGVLAEVGGDQKWGPCSAANSRCVLGGANPVAHCLPAEGRQRSTSQEGAEDKPLNRRSFAFVILCYRSVWLEMCVMGWASFGGGQHAFGVAGKFRTAPAGAVVPVCAFLAKREVLLPVPVAQLPQLCRVSRCQPTLCWWVTQCNEFPLLRSVGLMNVLIALDNWITWANLQIFTGNHCNERILKYYIKV